MIRNEGLTNFRFRELTPEECNPEAVEEIAREIAREPFDLLQGPLYRVALLRRSVDDHVLTFTIHHAIADGWTLGVFIQELCLAYFQFVRGAREPLPPIPLTYSAWGAAERAFWQPAELATRAAFWKAHLAGHQRLWNALEGPRTAAGPHTRIVSHFPAELANAARELARRAGATLFSTLLTAFQVTIAHWTGRTTSSSARRWPIARNRTPAKRWVTSPALSRCAGGSMRKRPLPPRCGRSIRTR
jgi:hypothetical protein